MSLNTLAPTIGSSGKRRRVGRGIGSGVGKTCAKGHKGQRARSGASRNKLGFEGGQMPLQRRLPKFGFTSRRKADVAMLTLTQLDRIDDVSITLALLKQKRLVRSHIKSVKIVNTGKLNTKKTFGEGILLTASVQKCLEAM